jgi:hypothetical protein
MKRVVWALQMRWLSLDSQRNALLCLLWQNVISEQEKIVSNYLHVK